jgi:hypothetical protein
VLVFVMREVVLDADVADVWALLVDADERAQWVGDEARVVDLDELVEGRQVSWQWDDGGDVTVTVDADGDGRTRLTVVERQAVGGSASASACRVTRDWDDRLLALEVVCLARRWRLVAA